MNLTDENFELKILKPYLEKISNWGDIIIRLCDESCYRITRQQNVYFQRFMIGEANNYFLNKLIHGK